MVFASAFYDDFTTQFFSANGRLKVTEAQRQEAIALCQQADKAAALACMTSFGATEAIIGSELYLIAGAPHGGNVIHRMSSTRHC